MNHPMDHLLRTDRLPHIWCPGCGIGTIVSCCIRAIEESGIPEEQFVTVSGIGCTSRAPGYINLDSFHTTHGRAIPFATGLKLANSRLKVFILAGDGDLFAIGGNHIIHAARRNVELVVICVNNFIYGMTGGQVAPTTPVGGITSTSPYGNFEHPFNLVYLTAAAGAVYVARWTTLHVHQLKRAIGEAFNKRGFSFIEVISPCPTEYGRKNRKARGIDIMKYFKEKSVIKRDIDLSTGSFGKLTDIKLDGEIVCGKFVDIERPTYLDKLEELKTVVSISLK
ncbi:MAG: 2-oxoacid:ferredoxin oxidoreductase subunit beta [bacterium]|nr:2-oxoacid:ferredoxin oxidoreductase subunit beta [bacterium]